MSERKKSNGFYLDRPIIVKMMTVEAGGRSYERKVKVRVVLSQDYGEMHRETDPFDIDALAIAMFNALDPRGLWHPWPSSKGIKDEVVLKIRERLFRDPARIEAEYDEKYYDVTDEASTEMKRELTPAGRAAMKTIRDGRTAEFVVDVSNGVNTPELDRRELTSQLRRELQAFISDADEGDMKYMIDLLRKYKGGAD